MKGGKYEREFVRILDGYGFAAVRVPSSGSATSRNLPDVIAGIPGLTLAIECKARSADRITFEPGDDGEPGEIERLEQFAAAFGARAFVAHRWKGDTEWYLAPTSALPRTDNDVPYVRRDFRGFETVSEVVDRVQPRGAVG